MAGAKGSGITLSLGNDGFLAELREEYRNADQFCQEVQNFVDEAGIPAINELRNAGHHLLKALDDAGNLAKSAELTRAVNHAKRACYEAGEAGALVALDGIRTFKEEFRLIQVTKVIKDYPVLLADAESRREEMIHSRVDEEDRADDYRLRMEAFRRLREIVRLLEAGRDDCNALVAEERRLARRFVTTTVVTALGIVIAAAVAVSIAIVNSSPSEPMQDRSIAGKAIDEAGATRQPGSRQVAP